MTHPFEALPESVRVGDYDTPIRTDFRIWVEFEVRLQSGEDSMELLELLYPDLRRLDLQALIDSAVYFYMGWISEDGKNGDGEAAGRSYDFVQDADTIFSCFWQVYGIDLSTEHLHWWKFCRLLWGLPGDCAFMRIIHYRTADLTGMDKNKKKEYEKMRKLYALRNTGKKETLEERDERMLAYVNRRFAEAVEYRETNR